VVFHDLAVPGSPANVDHLVLGPTGVFVIDSKQWSGSVQQGADGLAWHNHLLRSALGDDRVLSDADVQLLATTAWTSLRPAA
jgi:nuclease-like protein